MLESFECDDDVENIAPLESEDPGLGSKRPQRLILAAPASSISRGELSPPPTAGSEMEEFGIDELSLNPKLRGVAAGEPHGASEAEQEEFLPTLDQRPASSGSGGAEILALDDHEEVSEPSESRRQSPTPSQKSDRNNDRNCVIM